MQLRTILEFGTSSGAFIVGDFGAFAVCRVPGKPLRVTRNLKLEPEAQTPRRTFQPSLYLAGIAVGSDKRQLTRVLQVRFKDIAELPSPEIARR